MNPPVTRGARATYPVPTGRHTPEFPRQVQHAASVQFGNGSRHIPNPEQLDPSVYGQYRKAECYAGQNAQCNSSSLRRSAEDGRRRVSFGDDNAKPVRQSRDKTMVRPRSVNCTTQWETSNQAAQSGHKTVRRPRSVTFALPDEKHAHNSLPNQRKDSRIQQAEARQDGHYASRPPEDEGAYSRTGHHQNQAPSQSFQRGYTTQQGTANTGDCRGRNASYRAACSTTNQQKARAMQQIMNGYETVNPSDHNRLNKSYSSPPGYSEYVAMSQQHAPDGVNHSAQNVKQQRTTHKAGYNRTNTAHEESGYEEMRPQHFNTSVACSSVTTQQNVAYSNTAGIQQNPPYGTVAMHQEQNPSYRNAAAQQRGASRSGSTQHNPPYSTAATQPNGIYSHAARQENGAYHPADGAAQQIPPHSMAAAQQDVTYSHVTSQQYGAYRPAATAQQSLPYSASATQYSGTYSHATSQQNGSYSHSAYSTAATHQNGTCNPAVTAQQSFTHNASTTQQNGRYSHSTSQQNGAYWHATSQQNGSYSHSAYSTTATHQNGTYNPSVTAQQSSSHNASATQQNGTYSHATSQQNGPYSQSAYSTAATHQNGTYSHATSQQNGTYYPATTQQNVIHSNHHGDNTAYQENGYDGYDSSDSEFDDTDDDHLYDYVNLKQWNGAENGTNESADQDSHYQHSDR